MTSPNLPARVVEHFSAKLERVERSQLVRSQAALSAIYRDGGHSSIAVPDSAAALAYAVARMPATYGACTRAFDLAALQSPSFAPRRMLDIGSGPGTAVLAATEVWDTLSEAIVVEPNPNLSALATEVTASCTQLSVRLISAEIQSEIKKLPGLDLLTMSYVLAEQPDAQVARFVQSAAEAVGSLMVIVEPGTPTGYQKILAARDTLLKAGFTILAPCPHERTCPLQSGDWCHFSVRVQRTAAHRHLKGADVPFEDERFSFLAASRKPIGTATGARLLRPTEIQKGFVEMTVCAADGITNRRVRRRDASAYKKAKDLRWGDPV